MEKYKKATEYEAAMSALERDRAKATTPEQRLLTTEAANQLKQAYGRTANNGTTASGGGVAKQDYEAGSFGGSAAGGTPENIYKKTLDRLAPKQSFRYDAQSDPSYQAYSKTYAREGQRATANALAQASAASGGRPSSYAVSAAAQAGNYYGAQLADKLPQLEQNAYQRYLDQEAQRMAVEQKAYDRSQDAYDRQWNEDQRAYDREQDAYTRRWNEDQRDYERGVYADETAYTRAWNEEQRKYDREQDAYDRQWNEDQRAYDREQDAYTRRWNEDQRDYERGVYADETAYTRAWNEEQRKYDREQDAYDRQWNEEQRDYERDVYADERDYSRSETLRQEGRDDALSAAMVMAEAGDYSRLAKIYGLSEEETAKLVGGLTGGDAESVETGNGTNGNNAGSMSDGDNATNLKNVEAKSSTKTDRFVRGHMSLEDAKKRGITEKEYLSMVEDWLASADLKDSEFKWLLDHYGLM